MAGKALTREAFCSADDRPVREYALDPALYGEGAILLLKAWDGQSRSDFERDWMDREAKKDPAAFRWDVISKTVCDELGARLFTDDDRDVVMGKSAATIEDLFEACCELNGLRKKDVEALEGN